MHKAMSNYLSRQNGKMIHDPLALAVALDESVCTLVEVELYSHGANGEQWGCWPSSGSGTWISVDYDEARFRATLLHDGFVKSSSWCRVEEGHVEKTLQEEHVVASGFSCTEKDVLKLAKKLRAIQKLEDLSASGATLQRNQQDKINGKKEVEAEFLGLVELLPAESDVIVQVSELIPTTKQVTSCVDEFTMEDVPAMEEVEGGDNEKDVSVELQSELQEHAGKSNSTEFGNTSVESKTERPAIECTRRMRPRGGRSGFMRRYDAKHSA
jgi:hypothetical protein